MSLRSNPNLLKKKVKGVIERFLKSENYLLKINIHERSIVHKLAEFLQRIFKKYKYVVDCEYNRILDNQKKTRGVSVYPDIIVHRRGLKDNLLAIEVKKSTSKHPSSDVEKLKGYLNEKGLNYRFGLFILFFVSDRNIGKEPYLKWLPEDVFND